MPKIHINQNVSKFNTYIGSFLCQNRKKNNLTLNEVLQRSNLNITSSALSNIEKGGQRISAYQLFELSQVLNFSIDALFDQAARQFKGIEGAVDLDEDTKKMIDKL